MKFIQIFIIFIVSINISCKKSVKEKIILTATDTIQTIPAQIIQQEVKLNPKAKNLVKDWLEYQNMDGFILQYYNISVSDALLNATELSQFAQQLKDSIRIEKFQNSSVRIRLNVLYNETLRLADMSTINDITEKEVLEEKLNILNAYSALNLKINNLIVQDNLNSQVNTFIDEIVNSSSHNELIDSNIDTIQN